MTLTSIPKDFPREPSPGAAPGAHPKLVLRKAGDTFSAGWTEEELALRYEVCADLVTQLVPYARRKFEANPDWGREGLERRLAAAIRAKPWELTESEIRWLVGRACEGLE